MLDTVELNQVLSFLFDNDLDDDDFNHYDLYGDDVNLSSCQSLNLICLFLVCLYSKQLS